MKNNKKGFTLIELLAVIVILAILVMLAIPAVTRYLTSARKNTFSDNALRAVEAVRNDVIEKGFSPTRKTTGNNQEGASAPVNIKCDGTKCYYGLAAINELLETKLVTSPFGNTYTGANSIVCIVADQSNQTYTMSLVDDGGNGFLDMVANSDNSSKSISADNVNALGTTLKTTTDGTVAQKDCGGAPKTLTTNP